MTRLKASEVRSDFAATINRVAYGKERVILHRRNKDLVAVIPIEDLDFLQKLEDHFDLEAAREALKEPGTILWEKVKADLGL